MNVRIFVCLELLFLMHTKISYANKKQGIDENISKNAENNETQKKLEKESSIEKNSTSTQKSIQTLDSENDNEEDNNNKTQKESINKNDSLEKILHDIDNFKNIDDSDLTEYDYNNNQKLIHQFLLTFNFGFNGLYNASSDYSIFGSNTLGFSFLYNLFVLSSHLDFAVSIENERKSFKCEEIDKLLMINIYGNSSQINEIEKNALYNKNIIDSLKLETWASSLSFKFGFFLDNIDPQNDFLFNIVYNLGFHHNCKIVNIQNDSKIIISSRDLIKVKRFFNTLGLEVFYMRVGLFYRHQLNGLWEEDFLKEKHVEKNYYPFHFGIIVNLI